MVQLILLNMQNFGSTWNEKYSKNRICTDFSVFYWEYIKFLTSQGENWKLPRYSQKRGWIQVALGFRCHPGASYSFFTPLCKGIGHEYRLQIFGGFESVKIVSAFKLSKLKFHTRGKHEVGQKSLLQEQ